MSSHAPITAWRCHICSKDFATEHGGLCRSCGRATCDRCWGDSATFLLTRQLPRQCKSCAGKSAT